MMRTFSGLLFVAIAALPYLVMLGSFRSDDPATPASTETLAILSPHRREVRQEYSRAFSTWMREQTGRNVTIQWLDAGGTAKMLKDLESRYAAMPDRPGVDLLFGGGIAPYLTAIDQGWLTPVTIPPDVLSAIPPTCAGSAVYDPSNRWFGVALSSFGILYNRVIIDRMGLPTPVTWEDLGRPEYRTWLASGDPRASGAVHMCYEIILQALGFERGWNLLTRISANVRTFSEGGGTTPREVANGEAAAGMVIDQYAQTVMDSVGSDALVFILPPHATMIGADSIGALRGGPAPDLAAHFITFALSETGQRILFQPAGTNGQRFALYRLPVRRDLYDQPVAPRMRPYDLEAGFVYNDALGSRRWRLINDLLGCWMIEPQTDLAAAWHAILDAGADPDRVAALCRPPVTVAGMEILLNQWNDSRFRLETMNAWSEAARRRYRALAAGKQPPPEPAPNPQG
ncbi:MAG: hypothetical protein A2340_12385 [Lentisphaerae bacterium RIFOXYB12_FULL_60_10]|nr:MAG: hypothetical protein A2340_12385 [Lentisphaerae bacterium RIFOXYB12_FULL_60_10]